MPYASGVIELAKVELIIIMRLNITKETGKSILNLPNASKEPHFQDECIFGDVNFHSLSSHNT